MESESSITSKTRRVEKGEKRKRSTAGEKGQMATELGEITPQVRNAIQNAISATTAALQPLIERLTEQTMELTAVIKQQEKAFGEQIEALKNECRVLAEAVHPKISNRVSGHTESNEPTSLRASTWATITRNAPRQSQNHLNRHSLPLSTPSTPQASSTLTVNDNYYCTVDTSRVEAEDITNIHPGVIRKAIETDIRTSSANESWKCVAITRDPKRADRLRVTCRDEKELQAVKQAAENIRVPGLRILRDQLYPVKIDNANRIAVLEPDGTVRPDAAEKLGIENNVQIAKLVWLSRKDIAKAYGSMVIYLTKGSDATKLLDGMFFDVDGESAYVRTYEPRIGPIQCYKCQELGHKAFSCKNEHRCGKCANLGHHHSDCVSEISKCVPCGGPHESFSKNCRVVYPRHG